MKRTLQKLLLLAALMMPWAMQAQSTLTVCNGSASNGYVPVYGFYCDAYLKAHFVYPSDILTTMGGGTLTGMTFYAAQSSVDWGDAHFNVYLSEVPDSTISDFATVSGMTQVYSGSLSISNNTMVVTFDSPYSYNGGNLLVAVENTVEGTYVTSTWTGVDANGASVQGYSYSDLSSVSATQRDFLPRVTFDYYPAGSSPCFPVRNLTASNVTNHEVTLTWVDTINTGANYSVYNMTDTSIVATGITAATYTVTGLTPETRYTFGVEVNCSATDASRMALVSVTTDVACPAPTDLAVDNISGFTADVMWNGTSNSYDLEYAAYTPSATATWLQYDNDTLSEMVGSETDQTWTWGVMYPSSMLTGNFLTKVAFYEAPNNYYADNTVTVNIYSGGDDAPGTLIGTVTVATEGTNGMREVYINPIQINQTQNLWITLTATGTYFMALSGNDGGENGRWILYDNEWSDLGDFYESAEDASFMIRAFVDNADLMWIHMNNATSPYPLEDLTPVTGYYVRVKGNCGAVDGMSAWTATFFTTDVACPVPTHLAATDVAGNAATLNWRGFDSAYVVRYRTAATYEGVNDDFENGLSQWTIYTEGDTVDGHSEGWYAYDPANGDLNFPAHSGDYCASAWSWHSSALEADNWLVTPQVPLGSMLTFWVRTNSSWPDSYEVLLSTTDNDIDSFTDTLQGMAPAPNNGEWNLVTIDLSNYSGYGYIAIHHVDYDANYLLIDDFNCSRVATPAGEWVYVSSNTNSLDLEGLDTNTTYEFQVQGLCDGEETDWSESCLFTTNNDISYTVTVYVVNTDYEMNVGGTVRGAGRYAAGSEATLTATPDEGYVFQGWYTFSVTQMTADLLESSETYTVTVDSNIVIAALFARSNGIDAAEAAGVTITARENGVVVRGAAQMTVNVYDVAGRLVGHIAVASDEQYIRLPQTGVYLVKVAGLPARRIVVR